MRGLSAALCGLLYVLLCGGVAAHAPPARTAPTDAMAAFQRDLVSVLALRDEARPLLGAALLARTLPAPPRILRFHTLLERALAAPGAGPAVRWVQLVDCNAAAAACPNADALAALRKQAPDNAAVWMMALAQAEHAGDHDAARAALRRAAHATTYDDYAGVSLQALALAAAALPPPADLYAAQGAASSAAGVRAVLVFGLGSMQPLPGFQAAAQLCAADKIDPATRKQCLQLAQVLVWGSAPLARSLGLHLQATLAESADARERAREERRDLTWQVQNFGQLTLASRKHPELAKTLLHLARSGGTQMSLMLASLRAAGIATSAPADWNPRKADAAG